MTIVDIVLVVTFCLGIIILAVYLRSKLLQLKFQPPHDDVMESRLQQVEDSLACLKSQTSQLNTSLSDTPNKVLVALKSSVNNLKGDLGEFIQLLKLKADYDIVIPLGDVVDFLCIRFPSEEHPGIVEFVEVKTNSSRLSLSQKAVRELLRAGKVGFKSVRVTVNDLRS